MRCSLVSGQDVELQVQFFFELVTGEIFSKKEEFCTLHLQIWRKLLIECLAILYGRVVG